MLLAFALAPFFIAAMLYLMYVSTSELFDKFSERFYEKHLLHGEMTFSQFAYLFHASLMLIVGAAFLIVSIYTLDMGFLKYSLPLLIWWAYRAVTWSQFIKDEQEKALTIKTNAERVKNRFKEKPVEDYSLDEIYAHCKSFIKNSEIQNV